MVKIRLLKNWSYISLLIICVSCYKNVKENYPEEQACERFAGSYEMLDSLNNESYLLVVGCGYTEVGATNADTLCYVNFANMFSFEHKSYFSLEPSETINGTAINPLTDKDGNRWAFSYGAYSSVEERTNVLIGDSLHLKFHINDTAYYLADGVPYQDIETTHRGAKIH